MSGLNGVTPDLALGAETWLAADLFATDQDGAGQNRSRILRRQQQWRSKQFQYSTDSGWWGTRGCYLADNVNTHLLRLLGTQTIL